MSIRARLAFATALLTAVVFGVSGWLFLRSFEDGLRDSVDEGLTTQIDGFVRQVIERGEALDLGDRDNAVVATSDVVAQVLDERGLVLESTREAGRRAVISAAAAGRARAGRVLSDVRLSDENEPFRIIAAPVTVDGSTRVALVGASLEATDEAVDRVRDALVGGGAIAVLLTGVGAWFLAAAALRPVERMRREAADISEHDTAARLEVPAGRDEIAALGTTMNQLLTRLQDALARQRTFVGDASHELRTPLAVLRAELELAARPQRSTPELREAIAHAVVETDRVIRLADELLFLAQGDADQQVVHREDRSVRDVIQHSLGRIEPRAAARGVRLVTDLRDDRRARVDPGLLQRALDNLLENAVRYAPAGSTVTVHADRDGDRLAISVLDEGPGFPPEFLPHAFERFRRADDGRARSDGGSGLGLAIVLAVARAHGGTARAGNRASRGGAVTLELPDV